MNSIAGQEVFSDLNTVELFLLIAVMLVLVVTVIAALTGRDIDGFNLMRNISPKQHQKTKRTLRINGPLVATMSFAIMIGSPFAAISGSITIAEAALISFIFALLLWLSIRWTRWAFDHIDC